MIRRPMLAIAGAIVSIIIVRVPVAAQAVSDPWSGLRVSSVSVVLRPPPTDEQAALRLEGEVRRAFAIYPGTTLDEAQAVDFGLARVKRVTGIRSADAAFDFDPNGGVHIIVTAATQAVAKGPPTLGDRITLVDDQHNLLKFRLAWKSAFAVSANQWFGNGATLTEHNPRGVFGGGTAPNLAFDNAPAVGIAGATPIALGRTPAYLYGTLNYLAASTVGQDNNRSDARLVSGWEEAYAGVVGGGVTRTGSIWRYNVSYGMQPFCIGNGVFVCQIASSGGDRAADFAWPRWSAEYFVKAQYRRNDLLMSYFSMTPNDFPGTRTRLNGLDATYNRGYGAMLQATVLSVPQSEFSYYRPSGAYFGRAGLSAWDVQAGYTPRSDRNGLILNATYAQETNRRFAMLATAYAYQAGWSLATAACSPSLTYRHSFMSGDAGKRGTYTRWDFLYSGNDIDTWVQGQLMKNIQYNSNLIVDRLMIRANPSPTWQFIGEYSGFRADTLNNTGGVINVLGGASLGTEALFAAQHFVSRNVYWRFTGAALWPGPGVTQTLPQPVASPWLVGITQLSVQY